MACGASIPFATLALEHFDFVSAGMFDYCGLDLGPVHGGFSDGGFGAVANDKDIAQIDGGAGIASHALNHNDFVLGDLVLLAARADDREHRISNVCLGAKFGRANDRAREYPQSLSCQRLLLSFFATISVAQPCVSCVQVDFESFGP